MLKLLGADLVGMSTVAEVLVARQLNMKILGLSLITNKVVTEAGPRGDDAPKETSTHEILTEDLSHGKANHGVRLLQFIWPAPG